MEENIGAADVILSIDELTAINEATAKIQIQAAKYPGHIEKMTGL